MESFLDFLRFPPGFMSFVNVSLEAESIILYIYNNDLLSAEPPLASIVVVQRRRPAGRLSVGFAFTVFALSKGTRERNHGELMPFIL